MNSPLTWTPEKSRLLAELQAERKASREPLEEAIRLFFSGKYSPGTISPTWHYMRQAGDIAIQNPAELIRLLQPLVMIGE